VVAIALLFAFGSYSYVQSTRGATGGGRTAILSFHTEPPGAAVAEAAGDRVLCVTPCHLIAPGHRSMDVLVNSTAGDVRVDAILVPAP
jgi:hypothetical protein